MFNSPAPSGSRTSASPARCPEADSPWRLNVCRNGRVDLSRNAHKVFAWLWRQPRFESTHEGECGEKCNWWAGYVFAPLSRLCDSFERQGITEDEILDALDELESAGAIHRVHISGRYPKRVWLLRKCCEPKAGMYKKNPPNRRTSSGTESETDSSIHRTLRAPSLTRQGTPQGGARLTSAPPPGGGGSAGPDPTGSVKPVSSEGGNMPSEQDIFEKALRKRPVRSGSGTPSVIEGQRLTRVLRPNGGAAANRTYLELLRDQGHSAIGGPCMDLDIGLSESGLRR